MIKLDNLTYRYRHGAEAVNGASATIAEGIHLLLGENGAGKTTLLHLLAGLLTPQKGSCEIDGSNPAHRRSTCMERVFFLSDSFESPFRSINVMARCHAPFYPCFDDGRLRDNLKTFGMDGNERIKSMSLGTRRKAYAAYALSLGVDLLLLDEPANGLDIDSKKALRRMIATSTAENQTVIISTHTVADLQSLYDGLLLMNRGQLLVASQSHDIARRLSFVTSVAALDGTLYQEQDAGLYRAIIKADGDNETDVNYSLLYSAIMSDARDAILPLIEPEKRQADRDY